MQNNMDLNESNTKTEEANAFLRERFLYLLSTISGGKSCKIRMFENTEVTCAVKAIDLNFENIVVENLKTPLPDPLKCAILRTSDILTIQL